MSNVLDFPLDDDSSLLHVVHELEHDIVALREVIADQAIEIAGLKRAAALSGR